MASRGIPQRQLRRNCRIRADPRQHLGKRARVGQAENAIVVPVEWHTRFPNAPELVAGTRTELRNRYGAPLLKVATHRDGTLIEQYYYSTSDHTHFTVATLHNGTVTGAESVSR